MSRSRHSEYRIERYPRLEDRRSGGGSGVNTSNQRRFQKTNEHRHNRRYGRMLARATAALVLAGSLVGCSYLKIEAEHVSHPFAGPPFGPVNEEDSLNQVNSCLGNQNGSSYYEACLGYVYADGGFYGPRVTFTGRVGRKFDFKK